MLKINFTEITVPVSFNGSQKTFNVAHVVGNAMRYTGTVIRDIGFDKLAENIYFSDKDVELPDEYLKSLEQVITELPIMVTIRRELIDKIEKYIADNNKR